MELKIDISESGAAALQQTAKSLQTAVSSIRHETRHLSNTAAELGYSLGVYEARITEILDAVEREMTRSAESTECLVGKLNRMSAWILLKVSEIRSFEAGSVLSEAEEALQADAQRRASTGAGRAVSPAEPPDFRGIDTETWDNGAVIVKGENYDRFFRENHDPDHSVYTPEEGLKVETVRPSQIEGLHLNEGDLQNPSNFWGSDFDYMEVASHIPEVREALDAGRTLENLTEDPVLGTCASLYFDPKNIPNVEKNDGYYSFVTSGRHRILAAKQLGFEIPVRITGTRHYTGNNT